MVNISGKQIIPAAVRYVQNLAESLNAVRQASPKASTYAQEKLLNQASQYLEEIERAREQLLGHLEEALEISDEKKKAFFFHEVITKDMRDLREPADLLETIMDKSLWPFPSYGDLLYEVSEI